MLMNRKGFTLIELLATIVILSIIVMLTTPNIMKLVDNSKKTLFIDEVREFASKAIYLYSQEQYKNNEKYFEKSEDNTYKIYLNNIDSITNKKDTYGNKYSFNDSYITISEPINQEGLNEREVKIYIKSCTDNNCLYICNENLHDINTDSIKKICN